ncbi:phosphoacetylglucosamine mutase [Babesia ovis]|uniref:Phosphoacetylglucosamine mutase n=1 Tax=Babesia ovis TaxID=5869 RepID=A0A9W5TD11_BABOV|nr:phosphoacetylglucosamine mutase [Babesia ovis]
MSDAGYPQAAGTARDEYMAIKEGPSIPAGYIDLDYGTCGFRGSVETPPNHLDHVVYRCGVLLAAMPFLRNPERLYHAEVTSNESDDLKDTLKDEPVLAAGVVITASHNDATENGIKLLEGNGYLMDASWESEFNGLVNFRGNLSLAVSSLLHKHRLTPVRRNKVPYRILIGYDTRASSPHLAELFKEGVSAMAAVLKLEKTESVDIGIVTTPTVSFLLKNNMIACTDDSGYVSALKGAFNSTVNSLIALGYLGNSAGNGKNRSLYYDCSYGVGGHTVFKFFDCLRRISIDGYVCNSPLETTEDTNRLLNHRCGAHYVLNSRKPPESIEKLSFDGQWFCSFDGDADRLVYFTPHNNSILLIDGIRLLVVSMKFLKLILEGWQKYGGQTLSVGILINNYANGGAIKYIKELIMQWNRMDNWVQWNLEFCKVGVKHMQAKATNYHISMFYESNGHGNIIFNKDISLAGVNRSSEYRHLLVNVARMFNNPIGDAIANSLFVELALQVLCLEYDDILHFYHDLPYVNATVRIPQEKLCIFRTRPDIDTIIVEPPELQRLIELFVAKIDGARAFIRPSGTEPLCRVYAEAPTEEQVHLLADSISNHLKLFI